MANSEITFIDGRNGTVITAASLNALKNNYFNVKNFGATGDGTTSDTTNCTAALTAAAPSKGIVFFPTGTYIADLSIPDGVTVIGAGRNSSWIKGQISSIGSHNVFRDIKIGNTGVRYYWSANVTDVLFDNCWLFGGNYEALIYMNDNSFSNIRFVDCEISGNTQGADGVILVDRGYAARHIENITFTRCWFHDNDRMNFECIIRADGVIPITMGYRNCSLYDCIMDKAVTGTTNEINVSYDGGPLSDNSVRSSGYSTVRGCTITGGLAGLELAGATDMLIEGNTITGTTNEAVSMSQYGTATREVNTARFVGNNIINSTVVLAGNGITFSGNTIKGTLRLTGSSYSSVCGNTISTTGTTTIVLWDSGYNTIMGNNLYGNTSYAFLVQYSASINNIIIGNFIHTTATTGAPLTAAYNLNDGTEHYIAHNIIVWNGATYSERTASVNNITYSTSMTPNQTSIFQRITPTNTTAFTINAPGTSLEGEIMIFDIGGLTGTMGAITWGTGTQFKLATAFVNPSTTKRRTINFYFDGSSWIETNRAAADI